jgi:hypothetical protein
VHGEGRVGRGGVHGGSGGAGPPRRSARVALGPALAVALVVAVGVAPRAGAQPEVPLAAVDADAAALPPLKLRVALVIDPEFPDIDDDLLSRALSAGATAYAERFSVGAPTFSVVARFTLDGFVRRYVLREAEACAPTLATAYRGGGRAELEAGRERALRFFQRWKLDELKAMVPAEQRDAITSHDDVWRAYVDRYLATVAKLAAERTPAGRPLVTPGSTPGRSHAAWTCALAEQTDFDVVVTNTFILADKLDEPHPHAVFGKAKVGGLAGPNAARRALGGQVLMASTFAIDTPIAWLSELDGRPASTAERADILGEFLLAHEIAHAVFGLLDVFDHPPECLMTSRPGETYREGLATLREHPGPCPDCQPWVRARVALERARQAYDAADWTGAIPLLDAAVAATPKRLHGGRGRRVAELAAMLADAHGHAGNAARARTYADASFKLDPASALVRAIHQRWGVELVSPRDLAARDVAARDKKGGVVEASARTSTTTRRR